MILRDSSSRVHQYQPGYVGEVVVRGRQARDGSCLMLDEYRGGIRINVESPPRVAESLNALKMDIVARHARRYRGTRLSRARRRRWDRTHHRSSQARGEIIAA